MNVVGLDLSLTSTGIARHDGTTALRLRSKGVTRLIALRDQVLEQCAGADLVVIESYSFNSRSGGEHLGELGGVIRVALHEAGTTFVTPAPAQLKKYATGKGNAAKDQVIAAVSARTGIAFKTSDECDAWVLRQMGLAHYKPDHPDLIPMPAAHRVALDTVEWPDMTLIGRTAA